MYRLRLALAMAVLALVAAEANAVTLRGKVEDIQGTNRFILDCTIIEIRSNTIDLNAINGLDVEIMGTNVGTPGTPLIDIASLTVLAAPNFELGGNRQVGGQFTIQVVSTPGDRASIFFDLSPGYAPFRSSGVFLLGAVHTPINATIPAAGTLQINVPIPNDPALVGLQFWGQTVLVDNALALDFTNADCVTIQ